MGNIVDQTTLEEQIKLLNTTMENAVLHFQSKVKSTDVLETFAVSVNRDYVIPGEFFFVSISRARITLPSEAVDVYASKCIPSKARM